MSAVTEIKVRGYHADFYGHVNNARYLEFFEEDRWARLESKIDFNDWDARRLAFLIVNINVNYRKAVKVGEVVTVTTGIEKINTKSVVLKQEIAFKSSGVVAADALITFVVIDGSGKAVTIEGDIRKELENLGTLEAV